MTERLKPGDVLYYQYGFTGEWHPKGFTIENVGRKWATLVDGRGDTRVDVETLELDGRSIYGRLWRSEQEWLDAKEVDRQRFNDQIRETPDERNERLRDKRGNGALRKLVVDLSDALTDEGPDWSQDGLDNLRRRAANVLGADCPDWLLSYRDVQS